MIHITERTDVPKQHVAMCPSGHFAATGSQSRRDACPLADCGQKHGSPRFWTSNVSDQLRALCREEYSFTPFQKGCQEAHSALSSEPADNFLTTATASSFAEYFESDRARGIQMGKFILSWPFQRIGSKFTVKVKAKESVGLSSSSF